MDFVSILDLLEAMSVIMRFVVFLVYEGLCSSSRSVRDPTAAQKKKKGTKNHPDSC